MALAIVQHKSTVGSGSGSPPGSITLTSNPTVGNLLIAFVGTRIGPGSITWSGSWTPYDKAQSLDASGFVLNTMLYRYVQVGDVAALPAFASAGNTFWCATIYEVSGVSGTITTDFLAEQMIYNSASVASNTFPTILTQTSNCLFLAGYARYNCTSAPTISGTGWTQDEATTNSANFGGWGCSSQIFASTGAVPQLSVTLANGNESGLICIGLTTAQPTHPLVRQIRQFSAGSGAPGAYTLPTPPITGKLLIADVFWQETGSDPTYNTAAWTLLAQSPVISGTHLVSRLYRYVQVGDASGLPAITTAGTGFWALNLFELTGVQGSFAADFVSTKTGSQATGGTMTTTADTTTAGNQLAMIAWGNYDGNALITSSSTGWDFAQNQLLFANYGSWADQRQYYASGGSSVQSTVTVNATTHNTGYVQTIFGVGAVNVSLSGVSATSQAGSFSVTASGNASLTGVAATGAVGSFGLQITTNPGITGVAATAQVGSFSITVAATKNLVGVAATAQVGSFTPYIIDSPPNACAMSIMRNTAVPSSGTMANALIPLEGAMANIVPVYSLMRNTAVPSSGLMGNAVVACQGTFL